jgi:hypothetical protein
LCMNTNISFNHTVFVLDPGDTNNQSPKKRKLQKDQHANAPIVIT